MTYLSDVDISGDDDVPGIEDVIDVTHCRS
jgi:hypothetical protein